MKLFGKEIAFGKDLFNIKPKQKDPEQMYDFAKHGILEKPWNGLVQMTNEIFAEDSKPKKKVKKAKTTEITPKALYKLKDMGGLGDKTFQIKAGADYINEQVAEIDEKLNMIGPKPKMKRDSNGINIGPWEMGGVSFGREELESMRERLLNRTRMSKFQDILDEFPHTTSDLIMKVINAHSNLRAQKADTFVPDFPKEAMQAMKKYNDMCIELFNKTTNFYVIADRKDFEQVSKRRDPILLAQSPFGHFWQVLGAWDEEMIYLADL